MKNLKLLVALLLCAQCEILVSRVSNNLPVVITTKHVIDILGLRRFLQTQDFSDITKQTTPYALYMKRIYDKEYRLSEQQRIFSQGTMEEQIQVQQCPRGFFVQTLKNRGCNTFSDVVVAQNEHGVYMAATPNLPQQVHCRSIKDSYLFHSFEQVAKYIESFIDQSNKK